MAHLRSEKLYKTTILPGTLVYDESDNSNYIRSEVIYEHNDQHDIKRERQPRLDFSAD
jgi:hypothetical protein